MKLLPYKAGSASAKSLAEALGIRRVRQEGASLNLRGDFLINWGCSSITREFRNARLLNTPEAVGRAINKLTAFELMDEADVNIPDITTERADANQWIADGKIVVCREKLSSYGGAGIVIAETLEQVVDAPLYTQYIPKEQEYRIHVMRGNVFFVQRKARKMDVPDDQVNWKVRNLEGGFIYANQNVEVDEEARILATRAVSAVGLDFGAVDVVFNQSRNKYYVLEINTACGLSGTTLDKYVEAFRSLSQNQ